jgi:hypothetical protein
MLLHTSGGIFKVSTHACGSGLQVVVHELRMHARYLIATPRTVQQLRRPPAIYVRIEMSMRSEIIMEVTVWILSLCSLVGGYQCFRGTYNLHIQGVM